MFFYAPILMAVENWGGSAPTSAIIRDTFESVGHLISEEWKFLVKSGKERRWENAIRFALTDLSYMGFVEFDDYTSDWILTEKGRNWIKD